MSNVDVLSKLEKMTARDLSITLRTWSYAPFMKDGTAQPVCFVVSFRSN